MKSIFTSRTFWASAVVCSRRCNAVTNPAVVTIATIANDQSVQAQLLLIGSGVVHAVLRVATTGPMRVLPR